jgi:hypothetical protein
VASLQEFDKGFVGIGHEAGFHPVVDQAEGAHDVVRVLGPGFREFVLEDDVAGFLDLEFGAFDVV